jgi:methylthioxylose transferase
LTAVRVPRIVTTPVPALPAAAALVAALVVATGVTVHATTGRLGTATPPFVMAWAPRLDPLAVVGVALALAAFGAAARLLGSQVQARAFAAMAYGCGLAAALGVNLVRHGLAGWDAAFDLHRSFEAPNEYLPGLPALSYGTRVFLDRFAEIVPSQPVNVAGHPPGLLLLMHWLAISTPFGLAALVILAGGCTIPLGYLLARPLLGDRRARLATLVIAFTPSVLLFGVTSADWLYAAAGTGAAALLVRPRLRALGGIALALASLLSWALLAVAAWATFVAWRREGAKRAIALAAVCAAAVIGVNLVLAAGYGYDPIGALRATHAVYLHSIATRRPYAFWVLGSPVAWTVMLGLPAAWLALAGAGRREPLAGALFAIVAIAAVLGFTKAEVERIWLFLVPAAALACAAQGPRRPRLLLGALLAQALVVEALFATVW